MPTDVRFFESYAHADQRQADDLFARLHPQMAPSRRYAYRTWRDTGILVGARWRREISDALQACDFGLLLVTPAFLASEFIDRVELPRFVGQGAKPVFPVVLQPVSLSRHDLKGLEDHQLFRLDRARAYGECGTGRLRDRFAELLFEQIERRLDRLTAARGGSPP